ncbi:hypothetical protein [Bradyrhizobium sp. AS23.2]|uniref:hypothetical protein n=1 Tax=Bradyrhizobium sp. AS23.2 TaxID=1680155 RepID=UPI0011614A73|nr:hypothetical protein [Bradyrhizobium sp. AS23.2]
MPQLVEFEGNVHQFPDDFTQAEIRRALSSRPRSSQPPIPPLPPGYQLDPPAAVPPLPPGYKLDGPVTDPALIAQLEGKTSPPRPVTNPALIAQLEGAPPASKPGMFDDLIPAKPAQQAPTVSFEDLIPLQPAAAPAAPAATPGLGAQNAAQNGRLYVSPEPPKPIERPASILPSSVGGAVRDFTVGAQGVGPCPPIPLRTPVTFPVSYPVANALLGRATGGSSKVRNAQVLIGIYGQSNGFHHYGGGALFSNSPPAPNAGTSWFDGTSWSTTIPNYNGLRELMNGVNSASGKTVGALGGQSSVSRSASRSELAYVNFFGDERQRISHTSYCGRSLHRRSHVGARPR